MTGLCLPAGVATGHNVGAMTTMQAVCNGTVMAQTGMAPTGMAPTVMAPTAMARTVMAPGDRTRSEARR
jgi:hypothetical protein